MGSSSNLRNNPIAPGNFPPTNNNTGLTDNDFFFEHQKTRGYRLASPAIADCNGTEKLQEDYIANAVAYYLDTVCGAKPLAELLMMGTGELSIDMWAAVQRGKVRNKQQEVHYYNSLFMELVMNDCRHAISNTTHVHRLLCTFLFFAILV